MVTVKAKTRVVSMKTAMALDPSVASSCLRVADQLFRKYERELFASEGGSGGAPWKKLSPGYKAAKDAWFKGERRGRNKVMRERRKATPNREERKKTERPKRLAENKILQLTGAMKEAFTTPRAGHIAESVGEVAKLRITLGASGPKYFHDHFVGDEVPVRNPIQMTKAQMDSFKKPLIDAMRPHLMRRIRLVIRTAGA